MPDSDQNNSARYRAGQVAFLCAVIMLHGGCATSNPDSRSERLIGIEWLAPDIDGTPVSTQAQSTISFEDAPSVAGNGGCNRFFGTVKLTGDVLELGPLGTTRMACPETIMDQEYRFLKALEATRNYRLDDATGLLYFSDEQGKLVLRLSQNKPGIPN